MKIYRISNLILAAAVCVSTQACPLWADSSQWSGSENGMTTSRNLQWGKPKAAAKPSSGVVTVNQAVINRSPSGIQNVQYLQPNPAPPTPAQRDMMYPEKRPQTKTVPSGAVSTPLPTPTLPKSEVSAATLQNPPLRSEVAAQSGSVPAPLPSGSLIDSARNDREIKCPDNAGFKSIKDISFDIRPMPGELPKECPLITSPYNGRHFMQTCYQWKASALCTKAAYFEDPQLERYGHSVCPFLQPVISGAKFFLTVPLLPYKMGITPPNECVYTLGYYRPGNCAPYMLDPFPVSVRAVLFEAAAVGGAVALIP
jgi:hypothetical protein